MSTPLILLCGQAGSGKDTVANFIVKNHGGAAIAQADPMKRLAKHLFGFSDDQLWGPSESRNAVDARYERIDAIFDEHEGQPTAWDEVWKRFNDYETIEWLNDLFGTVDVSQQLAALKLWLNKVQTETFWANKSLTPRYVLQTLGTEWGRAQGRDIWTDYTARAAAKLLGGGYGYDRTVGLIEDSPEFHPAAPRWVVITDGRFRNELVNVARAGGEVLKVFNPQGTDNSAIEAAGVKGHQSEKELGGIPEHFYTGTVLNDKSKGLRVCETIVSDMMERLERRLVRYGVFDR